MPPELATGDGALGFRTALRDVFPTTREQRCWVLKTANVTGAIPKALHEKAKADLQDIWMAETKKEANAAFDLFVETYGVKYKKAVGKLIKDRDELLAFYDFPAEHWKHIRATNPIDSVFATARNRTRKTRGCLKRKTALVMVFRPMMSAKKKWLKISGRNRLPEVIQGVEFKDGIKQLHNAACQRPSPTFGHISGAGQVSAILLAWVIPCRVVTTREYRMAGAASVLSDHSLLSRLDRGLYRAERQLALVSGLAVFSLMLLAVFSVGGRNFFNQPLPGYVDWIEQIMPLIAFMGVAYTQRDGGHIRMDIFVGLLRGRVLWLVELITTLAVLVLMLLLVWGTWAHFERSFDWNAPLWSRDSTMDIALPIWPAKILAPVAFGVLSLRLALQAWGFGRALVGGAAHPVAVPLIEDAATQAAREAAQLSGHDE